MAKVNLYHDFKKFLELLNSAEARYLVLGGYAVIYYGHRRATDDLDVWVSLEPHTLNTVSEVLHSFAGFPKSKVKPAMFNEPNKMFAFGREPVRIDILTTPSGVEFDACYARREMVKWDGISVPLIALEDLKANKHASGRNKDIADIDALSAIERNRKK
jgi:predicted nucleotidyltransferase